MIKCKIKREFITRQRLKITELKQNMYHAIKSKIQLLDHVDKHCLLDHLIIL